MRHVNYYDWLASIIGASILAFGLGVIFSSNFSGLGVPAMIVGILLHGFGMYQMNRHSKS